jgi:hypothetical protein
MSDDSDRSYAVVFREQRHGLELTKRFLSLIDHVLRINTVNFLPIILNVLSTRQLFISEGAANTGLPVTEYLSSFTYLK